MTSDEAHEGSEETYLLEQKQVGQGQMVLFENLSRRHGGAMKVMLYQAETIKVESFVSHLAELFAEFVSQFSAPAWLVMGWSNFSDPAERPQTSSGLTIPHGQTPLRKHFNYSCRLPIRGLLRNIAKENSLESCCSSDWFNHTRRHLTRKQKVTLFSALPPGCIKHQATICPPDSGLENQPTTTNNGLA